MAGPYQSRKHRHGKCSRENYTNHIWYFQMLCHTIVRSKAEGFFFIHILWEEIKTVYPFMIVQDIFWQIKQIEKIRRALGVWNTELLENLRDILVYCKFLIFFGYLGICNICKVYRIYRFEMFRKIWRFWRFKNFLKFGIFLWFARCMRSGWYGRPYKLDKVLP